MAARNIYYINHTFIRKKVIFIIVILVI